MGAVDGTSPAPPELRIGWECQRYGCLPDTGGYFDQDFAMLHRINVITNVYNAYSHYRNAHGKQIHSLNESERRILKALIDMKLIGV